MGTVTKRQRNRRRLAAFSFLSNISLDGTHRDTKLGIYNLSLQNDHARSDSTLVRENINRATPTAIRNMFSNKERFARSDDIRRRIAASEEGLHTAEPGASGQSPRERVHSFAAETKMRLPSLSQKKKTFNGPEQRVMPNCSSTESIGLCSRQTSSSLSDSSFTGGLEIKFCRNPKNILNERVILVSSKKAPFVVFSSLPYSSCGANTSIRSDQRVEASRRRQTSGSRPLSSINDEPTDPLDILGLVGFKIPEDGQDVSYSSLLSSCGTNVYRKPDHLGVPCPHMSRCHSFDPAVANVHTYNKQPTTPPYNLDRAFEWGDTKFCHHSYRLTYMPNLLDDPELITGKHSTVLTFSSYVTSIIDYVKPSDLKKELNEKFRERFPQIQLTLSKLRSLKREMLKITHFECSIDLLTVAQAYVFFEKLILKMMINKQNRKLCAGACILLSAKLNDVKRQDMKNLIEEKHILLYNFHFVSTENSSSNVKIECGFRLNHKDLLAYEFGVLVALEFSLHLPTWEVFPHYQRLHYES